MKIFKDEIPIIDAAQEASKRCAELERVKAIFCQFDETYVTSACIEERRNWIESLWEKYESYADRDFIAEISAKGKFHERSFELYLGVVILNSGMLLVRKKTAGPDFQITMSEKTIWIEATAPGSGEVDPAPKKAVLKPGVMNMRNYDIETDIRPRALRFLTAVSSKCKGEKSQYQRSLKGGQIKEGDPYVIAVNGYGFSDYIGDPKYLLRRTLFGLGVMAIPIGGGLSKPFFKPEPNTVKQTDSGPVLISSAIFANGAYEEVSAILYTSNPLIAEMSEDEKVRGRSLILIRNPLAKNPLPTGFSVFGEEIVVQVEKHKSEWSNL